MATSLFFISSTDHNNNTSLSNQNDQLPSEPQKTRGRKPGSKSAPQQNQKKQRRRGMGVAQLERQRIQAEQKLTSLDTNPNPNPIPNPNPNSNRLPDPLLVLQGFPSYQKANAVCRRYYCTGGGGGGGSVGPGQVIIDPVCSPDQTTKWGFVETSTELSSIPKNPHILNRCDSYFKKNRSDGDVIRSHGGCGGAGGGFSKYTMIPPMNNGCYDHLPSVFGQDQRCLGMYYDHRVVRSAPAPTGFFNHTTGSMGEYGSNYVKGNPSNEGGGAGGLHMVKEYEFFPGKYETFPGKYGDNISSEGLVGDCSPNTSFIDLSLKL